MFPKLKTETERSWFVSGNDSGRTRVSPRRLLVHCGGLHLFGKEQVVLTLMRGLVAKGYQVHCIANSWGDGHFIRALQDSGIPFTSIYLGWVYRTKMWWTIDTLRHAPKAYLDLLRLYRSFRPDLVLHDSYRSLAQLGWACRGRNLIIVQDYWTLRWEQILIRLLDGQVGDYIPCSNDVREQIVRIGVSAEKIHTVGNPADFSPSIRRAGARKDSVPTAGLIGQVRERKGHHVVVEALAQVKARAPGLDFKVKVFGEGDGDYAARVRALAEIRGVNCFMEWCGYKTDKDDLYGQVDFTLVPTTNPDPAPLASIEPAVYGKPVIASAVGGLPEIVRDGVTGYLVPPNDPKTLADRMIRLFTDPDHARLMGEAAFVDYRTRFDVPVFVENYIQIIETAIERESPTPKAAIQ